MANILTSWRIVSSVALLFLSALSPGFIVLYLSAGFTDMIDGTVARKTNTVSEFGSKFDTLADFIFVVVCLIKILPVIDIPVWLWIWIGIIALVKIINLIYGFSIQKRFVAEHTIMNKVTGFLLFILPLTLPVIDLKFSAVGVCGIATFAAVQEGYYIRYGHKIGYKE